MEQPIALMNVAMTKIVLGVYNCGVPDKDAHEDGLADCKDICLEDPLKTEPRACGCGIADTDMDGNKWRIATTFAPLKKTQVVCSMDTNVLPMSPRWKQAHAATVLLMMTWIEMALLTAMTDTRRMPPRQNQASAVVAFLDDECAAKIEQG